MEKNYVVYQHVTPDGMYYFGQSQNVEKRWRNNGAGYKGTSLYPYIEQYGWENIQHIVLFRDQTKEDALWIEDFLIETAREDGVCINQRRSGNVSKDEGYIREYQREYYEQNREKFRDYQREYQRDYKKQNREKFRDYQREYREQNREKYNEHYREYREQNRLNYRNYQREYQREYRRRKKLEKQLKEVETTPLF